MTGDLIPMHDNDTEWLQSLLMRIDELERDNQRMRKRARRRRIQSRRLAVAVAIIASATTWGVASATGHAVQARSATIENDCRPQHIADCKHAISWWRRIAREAREGIRWQRHERLALRRLLLGGNNTLLGQRLAAMHGWTGPQWVCLQRLWSRESGWNEHGGSLGRAYGIPQALPGYKMAAAGPDWRDNPATQIRWGLGYIEARYGSPCAAYANSNAHNYY